MIKYTRKAPLFLAFPFLGMACAVGAGTAVSEPDMAAQTATVDSVAAVVLQVGDLDTAVEFYKSSLDATVIREVDATTYKEKILALSDISGTKLVLVQSKEEGHVPVKVRVVFNTADAAAAVDASVENGANMVMGATAIPGTEISIGIVTDADGNTLEFIQR